eukprot:1161235-Pelagomonas_calceolata.AAC.15
MDECNSTLVFQCHALLQSMGFPSGDRVFAPEKLPNTEGLLPSIHRYGLYSILRLRLCSNRTLESYFKDNSGIKPASVSANPIHTMPGCCCKVVVHCKYVMECCKNHWARLQSREAYKAAIK